MPMIKANGAEFYYEIHGKGQPLIIIPGYTLDYQFALPILEQMTPHFQLVLFDQRGVGRTKEDGGELSVELMAKDVVELAKALDLKKPHIAGQSMGGTIAQRVASEYPDDIGKVALMVTSARWRRAMLQGMRSTLRLREMDIEFDVIFEAMVPWVFGEDFLNSPEQVKFLYDAILNNPYPQSVENQARQFKVLEAFDGRDALKNIKAEALVINGLQDLISLPFESEYLADNIPNAKRLTLKTAHAVTLECPNELSTALVEFFK